MNDIRYGIFLRPDPATCWAVSQITTALQQQFGIVSAGAFPPHATLIGNLRTELTRSELVALLDPVFSATTPFTVDNRGVMRLGDAFVYNVHTHQNGTIDNAPLVDVAAAVKQAMLPISVPVSDHLVTPVLDSSFWGHLSLASHDLRVKPSLADEVGEFIAGLPIMAPTTFEARWFALYEFRADWAVNWWEDLTWTHVRSWDTRDAGR